MIYACATCAHLSSHVRVAVRRPGMSGVVVAECGHERHHYILLEHGGEGACDDYVEKEPESAGFAWAGIHGLNAARLQELLVSQIEADLRDKAA